MSLAFRRFFSVSLPALSKRVAVIGSGPSGFYTSLRLLRDKDPALEVDMFEKNPVPFGLARYGVAPDHQDVKNCEDRFRDAPKDPRFRFWGNVTVGSDILLKEVYENYDAVVYAYGSSVENKLGLAGEDEVAGVINSRAFVGWYNGDPQYKELDPPLDKVEKVVLVGNGNVAFDIARVLLAPLDHWKETDITDYAQAKLAVSTVKDVRIVARRGVLESKFDNITLSSMLKLHPDQIAYTGWPAEDFPQLADLKLKRTEKRRVSLLGRANKNPSSDSKTWSLDYMKSPVGFKIDPSSNLLEEMIFTKREVDISGGKSTFTDVGMTSIPCQLAITCVGYKCQPLPEFEQLGIPFDPKRGLIPNTDGKVDGRDDSFCIGWIANGSRGNINSVVMTSEVVAELIGERLSQSAADKPGRRATEKLLQDRKTQVVSWEDWEKIENYEKTQGRASGKLLEKVPDFNKMLHISFN